MAGQESTSDVFTVFKGGAISLVGKVIGRGLHVVTFALLARKLGPAEFGLFSIGWITIDMLSTFGMLGLNRGSVRFIGDDKRAETKLQLIYQSLVTSLISATFLMLLLLLASGLLSRLYESYELRNIFLLFSPAVVGTVIMKVSSAITTTTRKATFSVVIEDIIQPTINFTIIFSASAFAYLNVLNATVASVISFGFASVVGVFFLRRIFFTNGLSTISFFSLFNKNLIRFSAIASLAGSLTMITSKVDRLLIGVLLTSEDVGIYQATGQLTIVFAVLIGALTTIFAPMVANLHAKGELQRLNSLYTSVNKLLIFCSTPIMVVFIYFSEPIIDFVYGSVYSEHHYLFRAHCLAQFMSIISGPIAPLVIMSGYQKSWLKIATTGFLLNIIFNLFLIKLFGLIGSVFALGVTFFFLSISGLMIAKNKLNIWPFKKSMVNLIFAILVQIAAIWVVDTFLIHPQGVLQVSAISLLSLVLFFAVLAKAGLDKEDQVLLTKLLGKRL